MASIITFVMVYLALSGFSIAAIIQAIRNIYPCASGHSLSKSPNLFLTLLVKCQESVQIMKVNNQVSLYATLI